MKSFISLIITFCCLHLQAQSVIHSHNDYLQTVPFWGAYANDAKSIEADVLLRNDTLYVAHEAKSIKKNKTLKNLYIHPIQQLFEEKSIEAKPFYLLIDIKTDAVPTLKKVTEELKSIQEFLYPKHPEGIKIVISGNRPPENTWANYPDFISFDWQSLEKPKSTQKIGMVSYDFSEITPWNGKGRLTFSDEDKLKNTIQQMKSINKPIRFWANPDTKSGWRVMKEMKVDFIGTDNPFKLNQYLKDEERQTVSITCPKNNYIPTYKEDGKKGKIKNIILLIGDGMGVSQISSVMNHCDQLILNKFKNIGFSKTSSANDYITDSGAGGTAIAIGEKTNNRSIGVDAKGTSFPTLAEIFKEKGGNAGIITTDNILGATPSDFYAHVTDRGDKEKIANDLVKSTLDFFAGGGADYFEKNNLNQALQKQGFTLINDLSSIDKKHKRIGYFGAKGGMDYIKEGRGNWLPEITKSALAFLEDKPFFLMIEGAQIDNFGHFNETEGILQETIDFDLAVEEAVKYADKHPETLVIVTADHETGGFSLIHGNLKENWVEGSFTTHDHSGTMVPVFAYGRGAENFKGVYQNNEIFHKIIQLISTLK